MTKEKLDIEGHRYVCFCPEGTLPCCPQGDHKFCENCRLKNHPSVQQGLCWSCSTPSSLGPLFHSPSGHGDSQTSVLWGLTHFSEYVEETSLLPHIQCKGISVVCHAVTYFLRLTAVVQPNPMTSSKAVLGEAGSRSQELMGSQGETGSAGGTPRRTSHWQEAPLMSTKGFEDWGGGMVSYTLSL